MSYTKRDTCNVNEIVEIMRINNLYVRVVPGGKVRSFYGALFD